MGHVLNTRFTASNWSVFIALATLSRMAVTIEAPHGLIMLSATALLAIVFLVLAAHLKTAMLVASHSYGRDTQVLRKLVDQSEVGSSKLTGQKGNPFGIALTVAP